LRIPGEVPLYDLLSLLGATAVSFVLFKYFILPAIVDSSRQLPSNNNKVQKNSERHRRINQLILENMLKKQDKSEVEKLRRSLERYDFFHSYLDTHERVIAQCLVFPDDLSVTFDDIGGLEEVKESLLLSVCYPFQYPQLFSNKNKKSLRQIPKGILLYGPPGTGKTLLAKAIANACNCCFLNLQLEFLSDYLLGESEKLAGAIFSLAKKIEPCIIFIDEIDALLGSRNNISTHEARKNQLAILLAHWDGFYSNSEDENDSRVVVIGATNNISAIDPAALRRLPLRFHIPLPDLQDRVKIIKTLLSNEECNETVDISIIANMTQGLSGSDIKELIKKALSYPVKDLIEKFQNEGYVSMKAQRPRPLCIDDFIEAKKYIGHVPVNNRFF